MDGMTAPLPALRRNLELMPSPVPESPGLLVRDPFRYADGILILPPPLVPCLLLFDGRHDEGDLREVLVRLTGNIEVGERLDHLRDTLSRGGFLENEVVEGMRAERHSRRTRRGARCTRARRIRPIRTRCARCSRATSPRPRPARHRRVICSASPRRT